MTLLSNAARTLWWNPLATLEGPDELALIWEELEGRSSPSYTISAGLFLELQRHLGNSVDIGLSRPTLPILKEEGESRKGLSLKGAHVTPGYLGVLGVEPLLGRDFVEPDMESEVPPVIVSYRIWTTLFGAEPDLESLRATIDFGSGSQTTRIVGVLPEDVPITQPLVAWDKVEVLSAQPTFRSSMRELLAQRSYRAVARIPSTTGLHQIEQRSRALYRSLEEQSPNLFRDFDFRMQAATDAAASPYRRPLQILFLLMALVTFAAGLNVAILWSARHQGRLKEWEQRVAVGAGFGSLLRLLAAESTIPALFAFPFGAIAAAALMAVPGTLGAEWPLDTLQPTAFDLAFSFSFCLGMAGLVSLPSALGIRRAVMAPGPISRYRSNQASWQRGLLVTEVAIGVVVVAVTLGVATELVRILRTDLGFEARQVLALDFLRSADPQEPQDPLIFQRVLSTVADMPEIQSAGALRDLPLDTPPRSLEIQIPGSEWRSLVHLDAVSPGAFKTLGIPIVAGRDIEDADLQRTDPAPGEEPLPIQVWINESLAERIPGGSAVGTQMQLNSGRATPIEVAGVVGDIRTLSPSIEPSPALFIPLTRYRGFQTHLVVRVADGIAPMSLVPAIHDRVAEVAPALITGPSRTMRQVVQAATKRERLMSLICLSLSILVLILVISGVWAVCRHRIETRMRELAIRAAFGAPPNHLQLESIRTLVIDALIGISCGWFLSLFVANLIGKLLDQPLQGYAPLAFASALVLILSSLCAWIAGWRLRRLDLIKIMRDHV